MLRVIAFQETKFFFNTKVLPHTRYAEWMSTGDKNQVLEPGLNMWLTNEA